MSGTAGASGSTAGGRRVLVVDDSEVTRAILARTLRGAGFEVIEARDGVEGAVLALRERPSVVVTDLVMPTMDGFPLLRLLKAEPSSAGIPVLILTSHGEAASRFWSLRTGADAYLMKDHRPQELVATVERLAALAPPPAEPAGSPVGPLDVLARVARQLDSSLLEATLINGLLERGMAAADFHDAARAALETIGQVVDARFLAVAVGEPDRAMVQLLAAEPLRPEDRSELERRLASVLELIPGTSLESAVRAPAHERPPDSSDSPGEPRAPVEAPGASGPAAALELERTVWVPLSVRGATGVLVLQPRDPQHFALGTDRLVTGLAGPLSLVLDNARLSQRLHELSSSDGLTRLLNHRAIFNRLSEEVERARRYDLPLAVVLFDFDRFKLVNDTHGHLVGDAVLREGAAALRHCLRGGDLLGRYGGEEFLALLPQVDLEAGRLAAERLRSCLEGLAIEVPPATVRVTASFGVAAVSELSDRGNPDLLVSLADRRLYEAKAAGRNRVRP